MTEEPRTPVDDAVRRALVEVGAGAGDLASVTRPLLDALRRTTGLESTYLTSIDWDRQVQRIEMSDNGGSIDVQEGLEVPWEDTLCRRAMESERYVTDDVPGTWGDSVTARDLGILTYLSVPVVLADGEVYGTICGISSRPVSVDQPTESLLSVFSRIIADTVSRERRLTAASERVSESDRLLRARSQFVAAAQHRLKTPLTVILGWSSLLLEDEGSMGEEERATALRAIVRAAANANNEVRSMLSESEAAALALDVSIGPIDVMAIAKRCADDFAPLYPDHHIEVEAEAGTPDAHSDTEAIRIVLEHLIENAVKYSPDGGTVRIEIGLSDGGRVRVAVCDEGIGLPLGVDIFAPFSRGVDRNVIPGSGLGLHVVQSLVHAVGGEVTARRNTDRAGSTVTVLLPPASSRA